MFRSVPPITRTLIIANIAMFLAQMFFGDVVMLYLALWPLHAASLSGGFPGFQPWQLLTYGFLHGGAGHLFFNMFALYMFGGELELVWGRKRFLNLYLVSVISAGLAQLLVTNLIAAPPYPTIGASGGVFGVLLGFAMCFPKRIIVLLIPPIPMPAWLFVTIYGALELYLGVTGTQAGVAHFAHLGGMVGAWLMIQYWRGGAPFRGG